MKEFKSAFKPAIEEYLEFRSAMGYCNEHEQQLRYFDKYCYEHFPEQTELTKEVVRGWFYDEIASGRACLSSTYAATEMTLRRFTSRGDATFHFFYDYGDGWEVVLRLEEVFEDSELPGKELPRVLEGQGFGIIEDCGGPAGLEHLREVFQQKSSPEYQSMREWLGTSEVDLSVFDLQDLNFRLKKLPRIFRDLYEYDYPPTKHSIDLLDRKYCKTN